MNPVAQLNTALSGRYILEREIGAGGMATVYLARDVKHDRHVALKVLKPELGAVLGVERFLGEIKVTANLQHPNLLPLFDSGEASGLLFYVMPFVDGESLRDRLSREKQLPIDEAIRIATAVASALDYAHRHHVIHRDLKPENILLQEGQPVVADFGIALAVSNAGGARVTQTGLSLGTPQYMSPEQATGDRVIDGRSDIYSLAAVTYEMLTGEPPHTGSTMQAIVARVLTERARSVRSSRPNVPEHVERAIEHALEKLPADRWATAHEFADALQGRSVVLPSPGGTGARDAWAAANQRARGGWRSRLRDPGVVALAVVALAAIALAATEWRPAHRVSVVEAVRFPLALPVGVQFYNSPNRTLAVSPDGRTVAFVGMTSENTTHIYLRRIDDIAARPVGGTEGATGLFFSPEGRSIGFVLNNNELRKVEVESGTAQLIASVPGSFGGATWTSKGEIVFSGSSGLFVVPDGGGNARTLTRVDSTKEVYENVPFALPGGTTALYASWASASSASSRIAVVTLSTGKVRVLDLPGLDPLAVVDGHLIYVTASGVLMAVPFDAASARVTGNPVPIVTDVMVNQVSSVARAAVSVSGTLVIQTGSLTAQVVLADAHGAVKPLIAEARPYSYPRYSPDGKRIAVTVANPSRSDIWIYDIASGTPTRLTTDGTVNERPEWTPDGSRVLFRTDQGGRSAIWWRPSDLSGPAKPLLASPRADFFEGVFSLDGRYLAYQIDTSGADVYYRATTGDTTAKAVAATKFIEDMARISPDGRWIAYVTDESGSNQVVVQPFPGPGAKTQVSTNGGAEPVWERDGRRLFYRAGQQFMAATVRGDASFTVVSREPLFDDAFLGAGLPHANYDVAPDGTHFMLLKAAEAAQVMVVHNWVAELSARVSESARR